MNAPLFALAAMLAIALLFVFMPVALDTYQRFRHRKLIVCPENLGKAHVRLKAWRAGIMSALARKPVLRVKQCSRWPEQKGCDEKCVRENWPTS